MPMTREELTALRDAIDMTLALPDRIRQMLAQSLAPAHDLSPPVCAPPRPVAPVKAKAYDIPTHARAAKKKLLAAMRRHPGLSAAGLAKVVGAGLSTTKERLRRMGAQKLIEKARTAVGGCEERSRARSRRRAKSRALRRRRRTDGGRGTRTPRS
jgi:hypothetical protein